MHPEKKLFDITRIIRHKYRLLTKNTPVASMGSCFAHEIKKWFLSNKFNYLQAETDTDYKHEFMKSHPPTVESSAGWGRIYSSGCIKQIFDYSFGKWEVEKRWWKRNINGKSVIQDPYRTYVFYDDIDEAETDWNNHKKCSKLILSTAEVLIITLGVNEVWYSETDQSILFRLPPKEIAKKNKYLFRCLTVDENLENLLKIHSVLKKNNPECKVIITLSPVPLRHTFKENTDIFSADNISKSILRLAIDEFIKKTENTYYFPSFEIVRLMLNDPYMEDRRHITDETRESIMNFFKMLFVK